ncbi:MAG: MATE family efflux transporter [Clostridia bacterium]|nr:MATE family efflux transporter [Clostridia bacterium]
MKSERQALLLFRNRMQDKHTYLTETPIPRLIPALAVPTVISMLVTGIYNSADTYFVGRISTQATAAVGLVFSVMAVIQALGFFCGQGSGTLLSRLLGANDREQAEEIAATGFALALLLGGAVAALGNVFAPQLTTLIGATDASRADTQAYLRIILFGAPFMTAQFVVNNQLRFQGSAFYAMIGLMVGAVMNIALDPLLMFVCGLGIRGAALATVCGQAVSFAALLIGSRRGENLRLRLRRVRFTPRNLVQISNGGLPSLVRQGMAAVATLVLNRIAGALAGDAAIAGVSIVTRVTMLVFSALIGFGQGYQPVCSYNYGAKRYGRVREGFFFCVKYGTAFMVIAGAACMIGAEGIVRWFREDPEVVGIGAAALRWQACALPFVPFSVLTNMMLQACGKGLKASVTSSARNGLFFIPLLLVLPRLLGLQGLEMTQAVSDLLTFVLCLFFVRPELRALKTETAPDPASGEEALHG